VRIAGLLSVGVALAFWAGCNRPDKYSTTMEVMQVQPLGVDAEHDGAPGLVDLDLRYADCPGDARRIVRADEGFSKCSAGKLKKGDKVNVDLVYGYDSSREQYRTDFVKIGNCAVKPDPKDDANYEMVQSCTDLVVTGATIGVQCDRTRSKELVKKCPWMYRE
jgi:hypothetical protein